MKITILIVIYGAFFMFAGIMHLVKPNIFKHFIPKGLPKITVNYIAGVIEFFLGVALFFESTASYGSLGIIILMLLFLPIHVWDVFRDRPAIGSKVIAIIRVPVQFLIIYGAYLIYQDSQLITILTP